MIKAICFDLDGVYFTPESFKRFKANLPKKVTDPERVDDVFHEDLMMSFKRGEITEDKFWEEAKRRLGITIANKEIFEILQNSYEVNDEVKTFVKNVRDADYKTCICSNNFETRVRELQNKFSFLDDFDAYVFSYQVGVTKPDKKIFEELLKKVKVKPEELVYSDDTESKLDGAIKLGINAFLYENFGQFKSELKKLGVSV